MAKAFITSKMPLSVDTTASGMATRLTWSGSGSGRGGVMRHVGSPGRGTKNNAGKAAALCRRAGVMPALLRRVAQTARFWTVRLCRQPMATAILRRPSDSPGDRTGDNRMDHVQTQRDRPREARCARRARGRRPLRRLWRRDGQPRQPARPLQGDGRAPARSARASWPGRAGCAERYVREWLNSQVAGGYVAYHAISDTYELTPEQALRPRQRGQPRLHPERLGRSGLDVGRTRTRRWRLSAPATAFPGATMTGGSTAGSRPSTAMPTGQPRPAMAAGPRRRRREARGRRHRGRRRLRPWAFDRADGARPSRPRNSAASTRMRSRWPRRAGRGRGGRRRARDLRHGARGRLSRHGLRPDLLLRLPARHGRSGRGGGACGQGASRPTER